jgi:hypothetical protein
MGWIRDPEKIIPESESGSRAQKAPDPDQQHCPELYRE